MSSLPPTEISDVAARVCTSGGVIAGRCGEGRCITRAGVTVRGAAISLVELPAKVDENVDSEPARSSVETRPLGTGGNGITESVRRRELSPGGPAPINVVLG